jgi:hypothetical protein
MLTVFHFSTREITARYWPELKLADHLCACAGVVWTMRQGGFVRTRQHLSDGVGTIFNAIPLAKE